MIIAVSMVIFFITAGNAFASPISDQERSYEEFQKSPHITFTLVHKEANKVLYEIELFPPTLTHDKITSLLLYREPSHSLIYAMVAEDAPKDELQMVLNSNPSSLSMGKIGQAKASQLIGSPLHDDHQLILVARTQREGSIYSSNLVQVHVDFSENFAFSASIDPEGTGCWTWGRCGDGPGFWGPYCDPCDYILCCDGDSGMIYCGNKCP